MTTHNDHTATTRTTPLYLLQQPRPWTERREENTISTDTFPLNYKRRKIVDRENSRGKRNKRETENVGKNSNVVLVPEN
jgi:hypothetical protein